MVFADLFFLFVFIPLFACAYLTAYFAEKKTGKMTIKNLVIVFFSLLFYAWGEPVFVLLLILSALIDHFCALRHKEAAGIVLQIILLLIFKYGRLFGAGIRLPIGISFFTFQSISYLADVRKGRCQAQKDFGRLLLYISMFPQLIAGPIVRYSAVEEAMDKRKISTEDVAEGIRRFVTGLGKKVLIADQLSLIVDATMGKDPGTLSSGMAWLGLISFSLQIYFDFSGYSDMAIGMGRCMGFSFPENFKKPYLCSSVTDFWRRWHISLGSFFRDYVYIPLGGNRVPLFKQLRNIFVVWALTGFWHGAAWNYLIWGLYFGILLTAEKLLYYRREKKEAAGIAGVLRRIVSLFFVVCGWGIFYFEDMKKGAAFFRQLFAGGVAFSQDYLLKGLLSQNMFLLSVALILCILPKFKLKGKVMTPGLSLISVIILMASAIMLVGATNHPFLYTRF